MTARVPALAWCPFADTASAERAASQLLDEGLVSCVNILPGMISLYSWNSERGKSAECGALFKTDDGRLDAMIARLDEIHPYETPAILGWRCDGSSPATLNWLCG